jgi:Asp-tRNA(Asn)/Glu-tRNA(Gln) amidotransferase A subunit family amidase
MDATQLYYLPATQLAAAIRTKDLSCTEVVDAFLTRIKRPNPKLNAYCTATVDLAHTAARQAEAAVLQGAGLGALHGVPFSLKDLTPTKGIRTTFGSKIFEHHVPTENAILVERLRAAGAILLGKTNTPHLYPQFLSPCGGRIQARGLSHHRAWGPEGHCEKCRIETSGREP